MTRFYGFYLLLLICSTKLISCEEDQKRESSHGEFTGKDKGFITTGAFKEDLPSPIFYETFIPLMYEYSTPKWNKSELAFNNWYTCISETAPYRFSCPVAFHMNKAILNLHIDFESLTPTQDSSNSSEYFLTLIRRSNFCDEIQAHFNKPYIRKEELEDYIEHLHACKSATTLADLNVDDFNKTLSKYTYSVRESFSKMENNFYFLFYRNVLNISNNYTNLDRVASAILSNSRIALQGSVLAFFYAERSRWSQAEMSCTSKLIPQSLVSREDFNSVLDKIVNSTAFRPSYDLSVGRDSVTKYYSLPLTDCVHTNDTFVIRILLPVIKKLRGKFLKLVELHSPPFFYKDTLCTLNLKNGKFYIFNEFADSGFPTTCLPNQLCSVTDYSMLTHLKDPCASALLSHDRKAIQNHCDFKCRPLGKDSGTKQSFVVHRISSNKYTLTQSSITTTEFTVQCENMPETDFKLNQQVGAWLVTLPCKCHIVLPGQQILHSDLPCNREFTSLKLDWIVPIHFVNQSRFNNAYQNDAVTQADPETQEEFEASHLSYLIDDNQINNYLTKRKDRIDHINQEKLNASPDLHNTESNSGYHVLWTIFIMVTIIIVSIQMYIIYELRKIKQISYPKEDRILYRVPDSPRMEHL